MTIIKKTFDGTWVRGANSSSVAFKGLLPFPLGQNSSADSSAALKGLTLRHKGKACVYSS